MEGITANKEYFENDTLLIHQSIADLNIVASDYLTSGFYDDCRNGTFLY